MTVFGVWTGYEDMEHVFATRELAEQYVDAYIQKHPRFGTQLRPRSEFSVIEYEVLTAVPSDV